MINFMSPPFGPSLGKIGYVDAMPYSALGNELSFHLWATLMETTHASPQITRHTSDSKVYFLRRQTTLSLNYVEHNPSHVRPYALPSQVSNNSISPFPSRIAAQKQTKYSMLQIKSIPKNTFPPRHLETSLLYIPNKL